MNERAHLWTIAVNVFIAAAAAGCIAPGEDAVAEEDDATTEESLTWNLLANPGFESTLKPAWVVIENGGGSIKRESPGQVGDYRARVEAGDLHETFLFQCRWIQHPGSTYELS